MSTLSHMRRDLVEGFHPEIAIDNFSKIDCDLNFYTFVRAICLRYNVKKIMDYGAGRNPYIQDFDPATGSYFLRDLRDLRYNDAVVVAVDVDDAVLTHPTSHEQKVIDPTASLDFPDESFDLIVSDMVFEHIKDPVVAARELQRVLKPGGWLIARTPNLFGYMTFASRLVPNRRHAKALESIQPNRKSEDVFDAYYRLNTLKSMKKHFESCNVVKITDSWEPAYFFGRPILYRMFLAIHRFLPEFLGTAHVFACQKQKL